MVDWHGWTRTSCLSYLFLTWLRSFGHPKIPTFIKMASNSRVTRTGVVGRAVWLFLTRVRSINWCLLLRVTIRTSIAAWSQGLRLTGRDIELCTRFDTPSSPELTPTYIKFEGYSYWCGWPCSVTFLQEYGRQTGIHSREWLLRRPSRPALRVCV